MLVCGKSKGDRQNAIAFSFSDVNKKGLFIREQKILETFFPITHYQKASDFWTHLK